MMTKVTANVETKFAAIKLIEKLVKDGKLSSEALRGIVDRYAGEVDTSTIKICQEE